MDPRPQASFSSPYKKISLWSSFLSLFRLLSLMYWASVKCTMHSWISGFLEAASPSNSRLQYIFLCKLSHVLVYAAHFRLYILEIRFAFHCCSQCNDRYFSTHRAKIKFSVSAYFPFPVILDTILANRVSRGTIAYSL